MVTLNRTHQAKKQCNFDSGWLEPQQCSCIASSESCEPNSFMITKPILLLQLEHGFYQQNGPEHGQIQDWYPNEKMVVVPVCLNKRLVSK